MTYANSDANVILRGARTIAGLMSIKSVEGVKEKCILFSRPFLKTFLVLD